MKTMIAGFNILMHIILCISCSSAFFTSTTTTKGSSTLSRVLYSTTNSNTNSNEELKKQPHIVVLGGGFGGINTALTLPTLPWADNSKSNMQPKITLIDKSERFVFLPLLYELCVDDASVNEVAPTFKSLIEENGGVTYPGLIASLGSGLPDLTSALQLFTSRQEEEDNDTDDECDISFVQAQVEGIDVNAQQVIISKSHHQIMVVAALKASSMMH